MVFCKLFPKKISQAIFFSFNAAPTKRVSRWSMPKTSPLLNVDWVKPGKATDPTILVFTGFGHRLDPWQRLQPEGWRVGVLVFPIGSPPDQIWSPETLASQLRRFWGEAAHRVMLSFSFGGAGATAVGNVLAAQASDGSLQPALAIHIAPVQWAKAPWSILRTIPVGLRLRALKGVAGGANKLLPLAGKLTGSSLTQFVHVVERYVGWDFVAFYLPYLDWIDSKSSTLAHWEKHPWKTLLIGARNDQVIPLAGMTALRNQFDRVSFHEVDAQHFDAVDRARSIILAALKEILGTSRG